MKNIIIAALFIVTNFIQASELVKTDYFEVNIIGKGDPVILLPGLACSGDVWENTVKVLSKKYECHIVNLAGFGDLAAPENPFPYLENQKNKIINYIAANNLQPIKIIGHSLGGFLALMIASENKIFIDKIIIVDAFPFLSSGMNSAVTMEQAKSQAVNMKNMLLAQPDSTFKTNERMILGTMISDENNIEKVLNWAVKSDRKIVAEAMYELMTTDLREKLKEIKCKSLILGSWIGGKDYGMTESFVHARFNEEYKNLNNTEIKISPDAKHFIMFDAPGWLNEQIVNFF